MMKHFKAFSLIEMMVTITVIAFMLVLVIPSVENILGSNQSRALSDELALSLRLAKTEAIRLNTAVSLCAASTSSQNACGSDLTFQNGWIIFKDDNSSGSFSSSDDILKVGPRPKSHVTLSSNQSTFTFDNMGFLTSNATSITVSPLHCNNSQRIVNLSSVGRVNVSESQC